MRPLKLMEMFNIPGMAKESSGVIFVYSISLVWNKRKKYTLKKLKFRCQKCGSPVFERIQSWFVRSICNVFILLLCSS